MIIRERERARACVLACPRPHVTSTLPRAFWGGMPPVAKLTGSVKGVCMCALALAGVCVRVHVHLPVV